MTERRLHYRISGRSGYWVPLTCLVAVLAVLMGPWSVSSEERPTAKISLLIATGMPGDTYYRVGLGMASLWTTRLRKTGIRVSAAVSEGSRENIEALRISDADLILVEDLICSMAYSGKGIYKKHGVPELRTIAALWDDTFHVLIRSDRMKTGSLADLKGLTLATGLPESGTRILTEMILRALAAKGSKVHLRSMSNQAAAEALGKGTVQALALSGGVPVPVISNLLGHGEASLSFLEVTDQEMEAVRRAGLKNLFRKELKSGTYPGRKKPVATVAQRNLLAVTAALDVQVVYALTKTFFENLDYLARLHPAGREIDEEDALRDLDIPLHEGAYRYYKERKIRVPDHLIPR
jgi:uncharacterized protein